MTNETHAFPRAAFDRQSAFLLLVPLGLASCTFGLDGVPGIEPALSAPIMTYEEYGAIEHSEPYVLRLDGAAGSLLYFGSSHTTDPVNAQIDSIVRLWEAFQPTVALAEARKARRGSMEGGVKWFGESAVPVWLARDAGIPVYTFEPPLEVEMATLLRSWSKERLLMFYVLRSYTARALAQRSDGQARELIRERGRWPGLAGAIRSVAHMDSIWQFEFPAGPGWRALPWQATWPTGTETWINQVSRDVNRFRDQYMVALVTTLLERGERVFAVVGYSHVAMQEAALREALGAPAQAVDARIAPPPVFERLRGEWLGEGTLLGRAARFTMRWQHGDGFAVLTFSNAFVDAAGNATPVLNAAAVYRTDGDKPEAVWLDSRGERIEIRWEATDSALVSHWTAPNERGRTTYSARSADEVEVVDEVLSGETWRTFGTARFTRRDVERAPARGRGGTTR